MEVITMIRPVKVCLGVFIGLGTLLVAYGLGVLGGSSAALLIKEGFTGKTTKLS